MKKLCITALLITMLTTVSCVKQPAAGREPAAVPSTSITMETAPAKEADDAPKSQESQGSQDAGPTDFQQNYFSLIEGYIDNSVFKTVDNDHTKTLSDLLKGQYDVTGRSDGGNLEYYLAVRREDAPAYDNFHSVNVGYLDEQLYVGYYDEQLDPVVLYNLDGYYLQDMPLGYDSLSCFCFTPKGTPDAKENPAFHYAFSQSGRDTLDFIKSKPALSLENEDGPAIQFYYQDEATVNFYSEPYPCYISLIEEEQEHIRRLLSASAVEEGITTSQDASYFLSKKGNLCSTGAFLILDGRNYKLYGNHDFPGYMTVSAEYEFLSLESNADVYRYIMERIKNAVDMDYENFDPEWFRTPLQSASIKFPEYKELSDAPYFDLRTQTIKDRKKLDALALLMNQAISRGECGFSACPYVAPIDFTREDGSTLRVFIATDSCDSMTYEGRIGFQYGNQTELAAIFDEAMADRLTE